MKLIKSIIFIGLFLGMQNNFAMETPDERSNRLGIEFLDAVKNKDIEKVKDFIKQRIDINFQDLQKETALMIAINSGYFKIAKILIEAHANVNLVDEYGHTALLLAISELTRRIVQEKKIDEISQIIKSLIDLGANVNAIDRHGDSPLLLAAIYNQVEVVNCLIKAHVNVNLVDKDGVTSLEYATRNGNLELVKILLDAGAEVNFNLGDLLLSVLNKASRWQLQVSDEKKAEIDQAIVLLQGKLVDKILKVSQTPIADIKERKLKLFVEKQKKELRRLLSLSGLKLDQIQDNEGYNPLHLAILRGNFRLAEWLIFEKRELIKKKNNLGQTPLELGFGVWYKSKKFLRFVNFIEMAGYIKESEVKEAIEKAEKVLEETQSEFLKEVKGL